MVLWLTYWIIMWIQAGPLWKINSLVLLFDLSLSSQTSGSYISHGIRRLRYFTKHASSGNTYTKTKEQINVHCYKYLRILSRAYLCETKKRKELTYPQIMLVTGLFDCFIYIYKVSICFYLTKQSIEQCLKKDNRKRHETNLLHHSHSTLNQLPFSFQTDIPSNFNSKW